MARSMLRGIARRAEGRLSRTDVDDDARRNGLDTGTTGLDMRMSEGEHR
jgi:hypothetical protein